MPAALAADIRGALIETGALPQRGFVLRFFPVFDFQRHGVAALFCAPTYDATEAVHGHPAFHDFSVAEWAEIDCAILNHALGFAATLARHGIVAAVGASVGFATLSDPRGRIAYRDALRAAHAREQSYLVVKIEDVPEDTTATRIGELVASLRLGGAQGLGAPAEQPHPVGRAGAPARLRPGDVDAGEAAVPRHADRGALRWRGRRRCRPRSPAWTGSTAPPNSRPCVPRAPASWRARRSAVRRWPRPRRRTTSATCSMRTAGPLSAVRAGASPRRSRGRRAWSGPCRPRRGP